MIDSSPQPISDAQASPAVVMADAIPPAATEFDVATRMRITACDQCGIVFALPMEVYLRRTAGAGEIFCPCGHANRLSPNLDDEAGLLVMNLRTLAQLRQCEHEKIELKNALARVPAFIIAPIDAKELSRRINLVISRAERTEYGRPVCRFCGKRYSNNTSFKTHLKREHIPEISQLPIIAC